MSVVQSLSRCAAVSLAAFFFAGCGGDQGSQNAAGSAPGANAEEPFDAVHSPANASEVGEIAPFVKELMTASEADDKRGDDAFPATAEVNKKYRGKSFRLVGVAKGIATQGNFNNYQPHIAVDVPDVGYVRVGFRKLPWDQFLLGQTLELVGTFSPRGDVSSPCFHDAKIINATGEGSRRVSVKQLVDAFRADPAKMQKEYYANLGNHTPWVISGKVAAVEGRDVKVEAEGMDCSLRNAFLAEALKPGEEFRVYGTVSATAGSDQFDIHVKCLIPADAQLP